jgi:carbon-monoxide dehydrogenase medium subunit
VAARDFFAGTFTTVLAPQEVLTEVRVPATDGARWSYRKFHPRAQDWAIVGVAALSAADGPRVALMNMGRTPLRAAGVEAALAGGADAGSAAESALDGTDPVDDAFASADYRRHLARVLVRRALEEIGD